MLQKCGLAIYLDTKYVMTTSDSPSWTMLTTVRARPNRQEVSPTKSNKLAIRVPMTTYSVQSSPVAWFGSLPPNASYKLHVER